MVFGFCFFIIRTVEELRQEIKYFVNRTRNLSVETTQNSVSDFLHETGLVKESLDMLKEELQCPVCLGVPLETCLTQCRHIFCKHCLDLCRINESKCPVCRAFLPEDAQIHQLLNIDMIIETIMLKHDSQYDQLKKQQTLARSIKLKSEKWGKDIRKGSDIVAAWLQILEPFKTIDCFEESRQQMIKLANEHVALLEEFPCSEANMESLNKKKQDLKQSLDYEIEQIELKFRT